MSEKPTLDVFDDGNYFWVRCPYCDKVHSHGRKPGERGSHCDPINFRSYVLGPVVARVEGPRRPNRTEDYKSWGRWARECERAAASHLPRVRGGVPPAPENKFAGNDRRPR